MRRIPDLALVPRSLPNGSSPHRPDVRLLAGVLPGGLAGLIPAANTPFGPVIKVSSVLMAPAMAGHHFHGIRDGSAWQICRAPTVDDPKLRTDLLDHSQPICGRHRLPCYCSSGPPSPLCAQGSRSTSSSPTRRRRLTSCASVSRSVRQLPLPGYLADAQRVVQAAPGAGSAVDPQHRWEHYTSDDAAGQQCSCQAFHLLTSSSTASMTSAARDTTSSR